jgi:hypothetical protein
VTQTHVTWPGQAELSNISDRQNTATARRKESRRTHPVSQISTCTQRPCYQGLINYDTSPVVVHRAGPRSTTRRLKLLNRMQFGSHVPGVPYMFLIYLPRLSRGRINYATSQYKFNPCFRAILFRLTKYVENPRGRWYDNMKRDLNEIGWNGVIGVMCIGMTRVGLLCSWQRTFGFHKMWQFSCLVAKLAAFREVL